MPFDMTLPEALRPFVELLLGRSDLVRRLAKIIEGRAFCDEAGRIACEHGIPLDRFVLDSALRPDMAGAGRFQVAPIEAASWPPVGWLPMRSVPTPDTPALDWLWVGDRAMAGPFFEDDVRQAAFLPINWLLRIRTPLPTLMAGADNELSLPLGGLIFHMSRCGSTLLAQVLTALPGHRVYSEPDPLDAVLRWTLESGAGESAAVRAVRSIVGALGRYGGDGARRQFIKLDAWHTQFLPLFRRAFPGTPWVYLYRDSTEVMVSAMAMPGLHTVPGLLPEHLVGVPANGVQGEEFAARVLAGIGEQVVTHWSLGNGMVVPYPSLRAFAKAGLAEHFGLILGAPEQAAIAAVLERDAKQPARPFENDGARKRAAATPAINAAVTRWLLSVEQKLDRLADTAH